LKRSIIEFPFVAAKAVPIRANRAVGSLRPCIRNIVYRRMVRAINAVIALLLLVVPGGIGPVAKQLASRIRLTPSENTP
jgi:hypothetical protein